MKPLVVAAMLLCASLPAQAQDWGTYFNMGTFGAAGGSDANGWLTFECAGEDSGLSTAGQPYVSLQLMQGATINKRQAQYEMQYWLGDDKTVLFPLRLAPGRNDLLIYDYDPQTVEQILFVIDGLRTGWGFAAMTLEGHVATISLEGSSDALEFVEGCIADAH